MPIRTPAIALFLALAAATPARAAMSRAYVLGSDFISGCLSLVDLSTLALADCANGTHADARLRFDGAHLWVINRFGADNVQMVDPATGGTVRQFSVGNGSNPADVAWIGEHKLYVSRYAATSVWIGDPTTGAETGSIPLAAFADADGIPEMDHMAKLGPYVFVALQRLDQQNQFQPTDSSLVVVIDSRTDTVVDCDPALPGVQAILLPRTNPYTDFQFDRATSRLLVGCVGAFGATDGGIVAVDAAGLAPAGVVLDEASLGGDVTDLEWRDAQRSFAVVADAAFTQRLVGWSAAGLQDTLYAPGGFAIADVARDDRDRLWVCDNSFATPGVRLLRASDGAVLASPAVPSLPPVAVAFDRAASPVAGTGPGESTPIALATPWPNPARAFVHLAGVATPGERVGVDVVDTAGRRVATAGITADGAGRWSWRWQPGREGARAVAPGIYLVRASAGGRSAGRRVVVTR